MKITIDNELLCAAAKKVNLKGDATIQMEIMPKQEGKDYNIISVKGCDGHFQVNTFIVGKAAIKENKSLFLPGFFADTVLKMAQYYKESFKLTVEEGKDMILSCGTAEVPIPVLATGKVIPSSNPRTEACVPIKVDKGEFQRAVIKGTAAAGVDGSGTILDGTAGLYLKKEGTKLCIMSVFNGQSMAASSYVAVKGTNDSFGETVKTVTVDSTQLNLVSSSLEKEEIVIYIFEKQVVIEDAQTFYTFVIKSKNRFPAEKLEQMLQVPEEYGFKINMPVTGFLGAITVSELNLGAKKVPLRVHKEGDKFTLTKERNKSVLDAAEAEGEIDFHISTELIRKLMTKFRMDSASFELTGTTNMAPIFLKMEGDDCSQALIMPVNASDFENEEGKSGEEAEQ